MRVSGTPAFALIGATAFLMFGTAGPSHAQGMAERPMPVRRRAVNNPIGSKASALNNENALNQLTATMRARLRPTRSANQPPVVAPIAIPRNVAEVMRPTVRIEMPHCARIAGAENAKVLMSPSSKKKQKLSNNIIRQ